jgi:hypothetical protein
MAGDQLPLFQRKTYKGIIPTIPVEIQAPTADMTVIQTLPAYYTYLQSGGYSKYTPDDFTGDVKKFGLFQKEEQIEQSTLRADSEHINPVLRGQPVAWWRHTYRV